MRLDKYMKVSRLIKRREVAKEMIDLGYVSINGKIAKPSSEVKEGDVLSRQLNPVSQHERMLLILPH